MIDCYLVEPSFLHFTSASATWGPGDKGDKVESGRVNEIKGGKEGIGGALVAAAARGRGAAKRCCC